MIVTRAMYHDSRAVAQQCTNGSLGLGLGSVPGQVRGGITTRAAAAQREADPSAHARGGAAALDGGGHLGKAGHAEERQGELVGARLVRVRVGVGVRVRVRVGVGVRVKEVVKVRVRVRMRVWVGIRVRVGVRIRARVRRTS